MNRTTSILSLLLVFAAVSSSAVENPDISPPLRITILGTSDFHGALEPRHAATLGGRKVGGIDIIAAYINALRKTNPDGTVLLDAGDLYQGTLLSAATEGRSVIQFYNELGYDAVAIGNHEFDYGPIGAQSVPTSPQDEPRSALKQRMRQARFPFLSANIFDETTRRPWQASNLTAYTLIERKGVKIGIIGLTTTETPETTYQSNVRGLEFRPLYTSLQEVLPLVRSRGATVIVVLAHAGISLNEETGEAQGPVADLARKLDPGQVDLIISGHLHEAFADHVNGIPVLQAEPHGIAFARADLSIDPATGRISQPVVLHDNVFFLRANQDDSQVRFAGQSIRPVPRFAHMLREFQSSIQHLQRRKLGLANEELLHHRNLDSPVGNMVTDAMRAVDKEIDVAMYNSGGLRTSIPKGDITFGRMFEVMPFESNLIKITLTGKQIRQIVEQGLASKKGVMQISGLQVVFDPSAPPNRRCVRLETSDGQTLADARAYVVATNDFLLDGGDGYYTFYRGTNLRSSDHRIRQVVTQYIQAQGTLQPLSEGRYTTVQQPPLGLGFASRPASH